MRAQHTPALSAHVRALTRRAVAYSLPRPSLTPRRAQQVFSHKAVAYDYPNRAMRYDITYLSGPQIPLLSLLNFSS